METNEFMDMMMELYQSGPLGIAYAVVSVLVVIMAIVCLVLQIRVALTYSKANKRGSSNGMTGIEAARYVLDRSGHSDVKVIKAGFFKEAIFGNYYNIATKTIYLRSVFGKIDKKKTVTSTALAVQKAAVARLCEEGDSQAVARNRLSLLGIFGPVLFIPVILIGAVIDMVLFEDLGIVSLICLVIGALLLVAGFIVTFLNIPVEKKANVLALKMMRDYGLAEEEEMGMMKKVYDAYILSYIAEFILEVLRIVQWILQVALKMKNSKKD